MNHAASSFGAFLGKAMLVFALLCGIGLSALLVSWARTPYGVPRPVPALTPEQQAREEADQAAFRQGRDIGAQDAADGKPVPTVQKFDQLAADAARYHGRDLTEYAGPFRRGYEQGFRQQAQLRQAKNAPAF